MNKLYNFLILISIVFSFSACSSSDSSLGIEYDAIPVFNVGGTKDGKPFEIAAGINGIFQYTNYSFDGAKYIFTSNLAPLKNVNQRESLAINIQNDTPLPISSTSSYRDFVYKKANSNTQISNVVINYTNYLGTVYSSELSEIDNRDYFIVSKVESYKNNEYGQATQKLTVQFNCKLAATDGSTVSFENMNGTIAIATP